MGGIIENKYGVEIKKEPLYNDIWEYSVPDGYYFDSYGTSYGNHIYGRLTLDNFYTIRKKDEDEKDKRDNYTL